jgi:hypothetical protein
LAVVMLQNGDAMRGHVGADPFATGFVELAETDTSLPSARIPVADVAAIIFFVTSGVVPTLRGGSPVKVDIGGGTTFVGSTTGYASNGKAFVVVPDEPRQNVDRIWIHRAAVKSMQAG